MPEDMIEIARLLVTELVSHAVLHGWGTVVLAVARDGGTVRVEVNDENPHFPVVRHGRPPREHGNGLRIVAALAASWGTEARDDAQPGKVVWFTLQ